MSASEGERFMEKWRLNSINQFEMRTRGGGQNIQMIRGCHIWLLPWAALHVLECFYTCDFGRVNSVNFRLSLVSL